MVTGCATQKINWAGRVGAYTFDQAVVELGPPDKQAKLTDGSVVAEWLTRRGNRQTVRHRWILSPFSLAYGHQTRPPMWIVIPLGLFPAVELCPRRQAAGLEETRPLISASVFHARLIYSAA